MKARLIQCLLIAAFFTGMGTSVDAQERTLRSYAQRIRERVHPTAPTRISRRQEIRSSNAVSASRYRGGYSRGKARRGYVWVPGCYEQAPFQVFVPARTEKIWVPAVYATRYRSCGTPYQVLLTAGYWKEICHPARYDTQYKRQWVPGRYELRSTRYARR